VEKETLEDPFLLSSSLVSLFYLLFLLLLLPIDHRAALLTITNNLEISNSKVDRTPTRRPTGESLSWRLESDLMLMVMEDGREGREVETKENDEEL
jgi:hypothetical protein